MQLLGASAEEAEAAVFATVAAAVRQGRAALVWSDGDDVTAVVADRGETAGDVQAAARRFIPEVCA